MNDRIVVVSSACEYPDASSLDELYCNALEKRRSFRLISQERLKWTEQLYKSGPLKISTSYAAQLNNYKFDSNKFKIPKKTYDVTDIAHWLTLDVTSRAMDNLNLGNNIERLTNKTGVVIGNTLTGEISRANSILYRWPFIKGTVLDTLSHLPTEQQKSIIAQIEQYLFDKLPTPNEESLSGGLANTIAGRIANYFNFKGGAFSIDGACASSLLAVDDACNRLAAESWDMAICGGVDVSLDPFELVGFSLVGALSPTEMRIFDEKSNGFWPGEGCGIAILMRESTAHEYGLKIDAVVAGHGISSDGNGGLTRPTVNGQKTAISRALENANLRFEDLDFIECHGTGTHVGDQVELQALNELANSNSMKIPVGSIKANIGHTKAAAGMAGFLKVLSCLKYSTIPPITGCYKPLELFNQENCKLEVLERPQKITKDTARAGISAFGFGGINTHIILECKRDNNTKIPKNSINNDIFQPNMLDFIYIFSSNKVIDLIGQVESCRKMNPSFAELGALAFSTIQKCVFSDYRLCVVASSPIELYTKLDQCVRFLSDFDENQTQQRVNLFSSGCSFGIGVNSDVNIGFLYPGQGTEINLESCWPRLLDPKIEEGITSLVSDIPKNNVNSTWSAQLGTLALEVATTKLLKQAGIKPDVVLGHSIGEYAAWWAAGMITEQGLFAIVDKRGEIMQSCIDGLTGMISINTSKSELIELIKNSDAEIACFNSENSFVVAGTRIEISNIQRTCEQNSVPNLILRTAGAFHSRHMSPATDEFEPYLKELTVIEPKVCVISSISGSKLVKGQDKKALLKEQLEKPVEFYKASKVLQSKADLIIEVGPKAGLTKLLNADVSNFCETNANNHGITAFLEVLAYSFCAGVNVDFSVLNSINTKRNSPVKEPQLLKNPCSGANFKFKVKDFVWEDKESKPLVTTEKDDLNGVDCQNGKDPLLVLENIVSKITGLDKESLNQSDKLLADLHLNSITVADITNKLVSALGKQLNVMPTSFSESSLSELVDEVLKMPDKQQGILAIKSFELGNWLGLYKEKLCIKLLPKNTLKESEPVWSQLPKDNQTLSIQFGKAFATPPNYSGPCNSLLTIIEENGITHDFLQEFSAVFKNDDIRSVVVLDERGETEGFFKSFYKELPDTKITFITGELTSITFELIEKLNAQTKHWRSVVIKNSDLYEPQYERVFIDNRQNNTATQFDTILFTGGAKGIGLECANSLLENFSVKCCLVIGSSKANDKETQEGIDRLKSQETNIQYIQCDFSNSSSVEELIELIRHSHYSIDAIVHAAGINRPKSTLSIQDAELQECVHIKSTSLSLLLKGLEDCIDPKFVIGFGSVIARYGLQGESHYALANEKMWRIIENYGRNATHCQAICLDWSLWAEAGMAKSMGVIDEFKAFGIEPVSIKNGTNLFNSIFNGGLSSGRYFVSSRWGQHDTLPSMKFNASMLRFHEAAPLYYQDSELILENKISTQTDCYLNDHALKEQLIFPGVMILEIMSQTAAGLNICFPYAFESMSFNSPIIVDGEQELVIRTHGRKKSESCCEVLVYASNSNYSLMHASATVLAESAVLDKSDIDIQNIAVTSMYLDSESLYRSLFFNKGRFKRINKILRFHAGHVTAKVEVKKEKWFGNYTVDGMLLGDLGARDACLHVIQICYPSRRLIPTSVERISIYQEWENNQEVFVIADEVASHESYVLFDICILDKHNLIVEKWQKIKFEVVDSLALPEELLGNLVTSDLTRIVRNKFNNHNINVVFTIGTNKNNRKNEALDLLDSTVIERDLINSKPQDAAQQGLNFSHNANYTMFCKSNNCIGCDIQQVNQDLDYQKLIGSLPPIYVELFQNLSFQKHWDEKEKIIAVWSVYEAVLKTGKVENEERFQIDSINTNEIFLSTASLVAAVFIRNIFGEQKVAISIVNEQRALEK